MRHWPLLALALVLAAPAYAADPYVHAPGGPFLTDGAGRRLILHGVNLVPKCGARTRATSAAGTPCVPDPSARQPAYYVTPSASDPGRRLTARDVATLRSIGIDVVRLGLIWDALEPGPAGAHPDDPAYCSIHASGGPYGGGPDPYSQATVDAYLRRVDREIDMFRTAGIRVLLDMHQDVWGPAFSNPGSPTPWLGDGAPLWATCTNSFPFSRPDAWSNGYIDAATESALDHFWSNDVSGDLQGQYIRVFSAVARHERSNRDVIGYELFNEPADPSTLTPGAFERKLQCFYAGSRYAPQSCAATVPPSQAPPTGLIPSLLAADPHHLVFYEPPVTSTYDVPTTVGVSEPLPFDRLVLSFHDYGPGDATTPSQECTTPDCGPEESAIMDEIQNERGLTRTRQPGGPAWALTEFGASDYVPDVERLVDLADQHLLSWIYWAALQLHDPAGSTTESLIDDVTRHVKRSKALALARTYARAVAGTPRSESFDSASGAYSLTYTPDPSVHADTEVFVPLGWHYPHGYDVAVRGARVVSRPDAPLLRLATQPGATQVTVTLRARATSPPRRGSGGRIHRRRPRPTRRALPTP